MGRIGFITLAALCTPLALASQDRRETARGAAAGGIPAEVTSAVAQIYNAPGTQRESGTVVIGRDSVVRAALAVRGGTLTLSGHVMGALVAINSSVTFLDGARVDGHVYVVGGAVDGQSRAAISGDLLAYGETLRYRMTGEALVIDAAGGGAQRLRTTGDRRDFWNQPVREPYTRFDMFDVRGGSAYNRVEGYPILVGPRLRVQRDWGALTVHARGIVRTAEPMRWDRGSIGHDARTELRWRNGAGVGIGLAAFDKIDAVESWHLSDTEVALAAAALHRDYRDYYSRHGARAFVSAYLHDNAWISAGYGRERWESRDARGPWSLFRDGESWRANPAVDEGRAHLLTGNLTLDTRTSLFAPGAGWFVQADIERGHFRSEPPGSPDALALWVRDDRRYTRGFVDVRRYNRLAPGAQLNVRAVLGGWMNGDELPLQRRLSVGGPGTLPGFDFRTTREGGGGIDHLQCSDAAGPASNVAVLCDRVALLQVEYRGSLSWSLPRGDGERNHWLPRQVQSPMWMVYADAGRGWRAHGDAASGYLPTSFPELSTFKTDIGVGLAWESASISVAKSLSDRREPANVVLRLNRRF